MKFLLVKSEYPVYQFLNLNNKKIRLNFFESMLFFKNIPKLKIVKNLVDHFKL